MEHNTISPDEFVRGYPRKEHTLRGEVEPDDTVNVWLDGKLLTPERSQEVRNHSPDGFMWGYEGSGPAQLALAIMLELTGKSNGYQTLKRRLISNLPIGLPFDVKFDLAEMMQEKT
jgi:hypothetical protein